MRVTVKLFAGHRELAGRSSLTLDLAEGATVEDAFNVLSTEFPSLAATDSFTRFARNRQVVDRTEHLEAGDELALLQPVSGGDDRDLVEVTDAKLSLDQCVQRVESPDCGAIVTFTGTVRDNSEGKPTDHLEYEAYKEMAEEMLRGILTEVHQRWTVGSVAVQHRTGRLEIGEASVVIAVSAPHRAEAFEACRHVIERLKADAPIWKKEFGDGNEEWVGTSGTTS